MEEKDENKVVTPETEQEEKKKEENKVVEPETEKKESTETKKKEELKNNTKSDVTKKKVNTSSKGENEKSKNKTIGVIIVVICIISVAIIAYMIFIAGSPKKAVNDMLKEAKTNILEEDIFSNLIQGKEGKEEIQKLIFENLSWKIVKETKQEDIATVEVEVTNKDFKTIMNNFQQKAIKALFNGENVGTENTEQYLLEELRNSDIKNVTNIYTITVEKRDGKWQILEDNDIIDILLPGVNEVIKSLT